MIILHQFIDNRSKIRKTLPILFVILMQSSCQNLQTKTGPNGRERVLVPIKQHGPKGLVESRPSQQDLAEGRGDDNSRPETEPALESLPPELAPREPLRIGLILGAGGALTYGHIAFLKSLNREKIRVEFVSGIELAAPIAALYARKQSANEVEWQMYKLRDDQVLKKNLFGQREWHLPVQTIHSFLKDTFGGLKISQLDLPFSCASFSPQRGEIRLFLDGGVEEALLACLPYPPTFSPKITQLAAVREVKRLAFEMRQHGANHLVFVNTLPSPKILLEQNGSTEGLLWSEVSMEYLKSKPLVDDIVDLYPSGFTMEDYDKRREIQFRASARVEQTLPELMKKWGYL